MHGYVRALLSLVEADDSPIVIPVREEDVYVLSKYKDTFEDHCSAIVPSFDVLRTVYDRLRLIEIAESAGVPVPETRLLTDVDDWDRELIVKSRWNLLSNEFVDSCPPDELSRVKKLIHLEPGKQPDSDGICEELRHVPIAQEFIPREDEYMFAALCDHGVPLATFQHRQIRGNSYRGGGGVYRESVYDPELESVALRLLDHLNWNGLACIEYVKDANTDEFVLMEINPRMWQSLSATVRMGADFPYYYWLHATDRSEKIDPQYVIGVGCHYLRGEIEYLMSVLREDSPLIEPPPVPCALWEFASSVVEQPNFDYLCRDDPLPLVDELVTSARTFLGYG